MPEANICTLTRDRAWEPCNAHTGDVHTDTHIHVRAQFSPASLPAVATGGFSPTGKRNKFGLHIPTQSVNLFVKFENNFCVLWFLASLTGGSEHYVLGNNTNCAPYACKRRDHVNNCQLALVFAPLFCWYLRFILVARRRLLLDKWKESVPGGPKTRCVFSGSIIRARARIICAPGRLPRFFGWRHVAPIYPIGELTNDVITWL